MSGMSDSDPTRLVHQARRVVRIAPQVRGFSPSERQPTPILKDPTMANNIKPVYFAIYDFDIPPRANNPVYGVRVHTKRDDTYTLCGRRLDKMNPVREQEIVHFKQGMCPSCTNKAA